MNNRTYGLLKITSKDRNAGAAILQRAFAEYELLRYYYRDEKQRYAVARLFGLTTLSVCLKYGEVYTTSEKLEGVAAWLPPGKAPFGIWQVILSVPLPVLFRFARQGVSRMMTFDRYSDAQHRDIVPYPHWYLHIIGVDPAHQGQGFASRLIKPILERIDKERMPCYLETHNLKNVSIYQRFGFKVVLEGKIPGTDLMSYAMLRNAQGI
jgi:ribosomal protein S18 acetylase RimI-like enzyme